jgi:hypothetical protein
LISVPSIKSRDCVDATDNTPLILPVDFAASDGSTTAAANSSQEKATAILILLSFFMLDCRDDDP